MPDRLELVHERPEQAGHALIQEDHLVFGVVDDVSELIGEQTQVEGVGHPTSARRGEVQLEVPGRVPGKGGYPTVRGDPQVVQGTAQAAGTFGPLAVRGPFPSVRGCRDHLLFREEAFSAVEDVA